MCIINTRRVCCQASGVGIAKITSLKSVRFRRLAAQSQYSNRMVWEQPPLIQQCALREDHALWPLLAHQCQAVGPLKIGV